MLREAREHVAALVRIFGAVDPGQLSGPEAVEYLHLSAEVERLGTGLKVRVAPRAADGPYWRADGHRSEASWIADLTRCSLPDATATLRTGRTLATLPATTAAAARGELSLAQLRTITDAAAAEPSAESVLLDSAAFLSVSGLQKCARDLLAATPAPDAAPGDAPSPPARDPRRRLRFWTGDDGLSRLSGVFTPDAGAELFTLVRSRAAHVADEARRAGLEPEPQEAYDADALLALAGGDHRYSTFDGPKGGRARSSAVVFHLSLDALRRGRVEPGERCDVDGLGPVAIAAIEHVLAGADLALEVDERGTGPRPLAPLVSDERRTQLAEREAHCAVPGCRVTLSLDAVVWRTSGAGGSPSLLDLALLCTGHHRQLTYDGYRLGGGPGRWAWIPPP